VHGVKEDVRPDAFVAFSGSSMSTSCRSWLKLSGN
jgi:hypothetical protein